MYASVPIETQGRIAADMALDLLELYRKPAISDDEREHLRRELRHLEPLIAEAARRRLSPFPRRGTGSSLAKIRTALADIELHAEMLAEA